MMKVNLKKNQILKEEKKKIIILFLKKWLQKIQANLG